MSIVISNLTKLYGAQKAIDGISFEAHDNEIVGFLGPNGAGKSTTMKIITGFLPPDSGIASVNGIDVAQDPIATKKQTGYLPEGNPLYYDMYVREYLTFIARAHHMNGHTENRIEEVIDMTGLRPESNKKTGQLSKGYKQRVGLAAALIHDPKVLILDEPTTGLDPNQIVGIRQLIKDLGKNKTVLFSSHILQEVESICDRVVIINKGKIVANDTLNNLRLLQSGGHIVSVQFSKPAEISLLQNLPDTENVNKEGEVYLLKTSSPDVLKKSLLEFAVQHHLDIISLQSKSSSLEDVFRRLTS